MAAKQNDDVVRILSIDGGGIRGILPARVLQHLEASLGCAVRERFHLIAGASTGGILACGLIAGRTAQELGDLYAARGSDIFAHSLWRRLTTVGGLEGPRYSAAPLESILSMVLGTATLSDMPVKAELLVPTYVIEWPQPIVVNGVPTTRAPMLFKSWKARGEGLDPGQHAARFDFALRDVARATSAAPTYFPPARYQNMAAETYASVDGGLFANNPAMCALVAAYRRYGKNRRYVLLSLGTGSRERALPYREAKAWGELHWLRPVLSILMDGNEDTVCYQVDEVLGDDHVRLEISTGLDANDPATVDEDFDCATPDNIARLERLADRLIRENQERLDRLLPLLSE